MHWRRTGRGRHGRCGSLAAPIRETAECRAADRRASPRSKSVAFFAPDGETRAPWAAAACRDAPGSGRTWRRGRSASRGRGRRPCRRRSSPSRAATHDECRDPSRACTCRRAATPRALPQQPDRHDSPSFTSLEKATACQSLTSAGSGFAAIAIPGCVPRACLQHENAPWSYSDARRGH